MMKAAKKMAKVTGVVMGTVVGAVVSLTMTASAATEGAAPAPTQKNAKKTTDVSFEDVLVQGKYHFSDEAVTTVEEDKVLDSLLGVRKDFQDRIKKSVSRQ